MHAVFHKPAVLRCDPAVVPAQYDDDMSIGEPASETAHLFFQLSVEFAGDEIPGVVGRFYDLVVATVVCATDIVDAFEPGEQPVLQVCGGDLSQPYMKINLLVIWHWAKVSGIGPTGADIIQRSKFNYRRSYLPPKAIKIKWAVS